MVVEKIELKIEAEHLKDSGLLPLASGLGSEDLPIYIKIDTGFDYSVLTAVIGFFVAIVVARFTVKVQRNQIQANISNFRHQWMMELRESASELVQIFVMMINKSAKDSEYRKEGYVADRERAAQLRAKIDLLLSRNDKATNDIRTTCGGLLDAINSMKYEDDTSHNIDRLVHFQDLVRAELEKAWSDTKADLGVTKAKPWYRSLF